MVLKIGIISCDKTPFRGEQNLTFRRIVVFRVSGLVSQVFLDWYFSKIWLPSWSRVLPEKPKGPQLLKKFPAFYGTRRFITAFTRARHLSLSWTRLTQSISPSYFSKIHFDITLPYTPGSSKWVFWRTRNLKIYFLILWSWKNCDTSNVSQLLAVIFQNTSFWWHFVLLS